MKKYKKKIIWTIVILALVAGGFFIFKGKKPKTTYTTIETKRGDLAQTVSVTGKLKAQEESELAFKVSGIVEKVNYKIGDRVEKGDVLAKLDQRTLTYDYISAQEDVKYQKKTYSHVKDEDDTYDKDQEQAQKALVRKYEAELKSSSVRLSDALLRSPIDGILIKRDLDVGEMAILGSEIMTVASEGELELEVDVPESDIIKVALGQKASVEFDAFSVNDKFQAQVFEIEPSSTVISDVVYYKVKMRMENIDPRFKNGMSGDVDIMTDERKNIFSVPMRAVKTEGDKKYVEVLKDEKNNITEKIDVTTGMEGDDGMVEIKSGLSGGEKVITLTSTK